jgi:hypothetical protein
MVHQDSPDATVPCSGEDSASPAPAPTMHALVQDTAASKPSPAPNAWNAEAGDSASKPQARTSKHVAACMRMHDPSLARYTAQSAPYVTYSAPFLRPAASLGAPAATSHYPPSMAPPANPYFMPLAPTASSPPAMSAQQVQWSQAYHPSAAAASPIASLMASAAWPYTYPMMHPWLPATQGQAHALSASPLAPYTQLGAMPQAHTGYYPFPG